MTTRVLLIACITLAACSRQEAAKTDSAGLPAVDTVKPATDSLGMRDSTKVAGATTSGTKTQTSPANTKTGTKRDSTIIGRDSVTPFDPKKNKPLPPAKRP